MQKTILCYGDSNTWGYVPFDVSKNTNLTIKRYSRDIRWPSVLQKKLGENYYIIEEGLNGRTTNINYHFDPDRNGKTYLPSCLYTHAPIDLVILALGGNDLKIYFSRKPEDIREGMAELINIVQLSRYGVGMQEAPKILIIPPPIPHSSGEEFTDENGIVLFKGAIDKAKMLVKLYEELAKEKKCYFLDISKDIYPPSIDGLHIDHVGHIKLAEMISKKIKSIFL